MDDADYFSLFSLPRVFNLEADQLEQAWKRVASAVHPDRFVTATPVERRVAMQWSARANEAHRVLRNPLSRARYLCELGGVDLQTETNTAMSSDFLDQQMEWHEKLDQLNEGDVAGARAALLLELSNARDELISACASFLEKEEFSSAAVKVREWMFLEKMLSHVRVTALES